MAVHVENTADAAKGAAAGGVAGGAFEAATGGLSRAAQVAGDVLRSIFGGLPWEMSVSEIVDAVTGGGGAGAGAADAAGVAVDVMVVIA